MTGNTGSAQSAPKSSIQDDLKMLRQSEAQAEIIGKFADAAASGDTDLTLSLVWPATRKDFGEDKWRKYISSKLYPFFKNYTGIDGYEHIATLNMEQNNTPAFVHFGYIRDANGARQPFEIVVVSGEEGSYVANIYVGTCRKGLHPICE